MVLTLNNCNQWDEHYNSPIEASSILLWDAISNDVQYSEFVNLIAEVELDTVINSNTPFTLFVPDNSSLEFVKNAEIGRAHV